MVKRGSWSCRRIGGSRKARKEANARANTYDSALRDVVSAFGRSGQPPASLAAEYGAHAAFLLADDEIDAFERFSISASRPRSMQAYVTDNHQPDQPRLGARPEHRRRVRAGSPVPTTGVDDRGVCTPGTDVRNSSAGCPQHRVRRTPRTSRPRCDGCLRKDRDQIRLEVETTIQGVLDQRVRPIECFAVARYALAVRAARAGSLDNEYTQQAVDRLQAYGDERIAECIAEAQRTDPSFQAYQPGEFRRAPRGLQLDIPAGISAPGLAPMEGR